MITNGYPEARPDPGASTESPQKKKTVVLHFSYFPLSIEFALRVITLGLWYWNWLPATAFWILQVVVIPIFSFGGIVAPRDERYRKEYNAVSLEPHGSWLTVTFTIVQFAVGIGAFWWVTSSWTQWLRIPATVALFVVYGLYTGMMYLGSVRGPIWQPRQIGLPPRQDPHAQLITVDLNDLRIVRMETEVFSISHRIESYTFESSLFGALAFSGFLTLIASSGNVLTSMQNLLQISGRILGSSESTNWAAALATLRANGTTNNILAIISIETLLCSVLFLAVIVSRLRFYDIVRQVEYAVRVARAWNDKEEAMFAMVIEDETPRKVERLSTLSWLVTDAVENAEPLLSDLKRITNYIWIFRNLGIGTFVLVLVTSAFLVSSGLASLFIGIVLIAYIYTTFDRFTTRKRLQNIAFFDMLEGKLFGRAKRGQ